MHKLNVLPSNPDEDSLGRFPKWLHRKMPQGSNLWNTHSILQSHRLPTVCEEAKCPNLPECYSQKTATFLAMGRACTRACGFCDIDFSKTPLALEKDEPERLANSVKALGLKHVVITMVARDDLEDGGSAHLKEIILCIRKMNPGVTVEVLTSDFSGNLSAYDLMIEAAPEIFNHNVETVRSLSDRVRHKATYDRSLSLLRYIHEKKRGTLFTKSGLMVGLGEQKNEVEQTLNDLLQAGCSIVTIGQYLQPSRNNLKVKEFVPPHVFEEYADYGRKIGLLQVYAGPFVRSSYNASAIFKMMKTDD